jgi:hypothetical protein
LQASVPLRLPCHDIGFIFTVLLWDSYSVTSGGALRRRKRVRVCSSRRARKKRLQPRRPYPGTSSTGRWLAERIRPFACAYSSKELIYGGPGKGVEHTSHRYVNRDRGKQGAQRRLASSQEKRPGEGGPGKLPRSYLGLALQNSRSSSGESNSELTSKMSLMRSCVDFLRKRVDVADKVRAPTVEADGGGFEGDASAMVCSAKIGI